MPTTKVLSPYGQAKAVEIKANGPSPSDDAAGPRGNVLAIANEIKLFAIDKSVESWVDTERPRPSNSQPAEPRDLHLSSQVKRRNDCQ